MRPRVAYVSPVVAGSESALRAAHDAFPRHLLSTSGIESVTAFIGGGYYVLLLEPATDDFQDLMSHLTGTSDARQFFGSLRAYLTEPLLVAVHPADQFHQTSSRPVVAGPTTADLPLAGEVFHLAATE
jgi:hypothetical protein